MGAVGHNSIGSISVGDRKGTVYAISFDMDTSQMSDLYPNESWKNGYAEIKRILSEHGFDWQQGSVYFGGETVTAVTCVLAIQDVSRRLDWFSPSVRDVRMLRIEENNDLGPAITSILGSTEKRG